MNTSGRKIILLVGAAIVTGFWLGQLFDIRIAPSQKVNKLRQILGIQKSQVVETKPAVTYEELAGQVIPAEGKTVVVKWGDMGKKLVDEGAVDTAKFEQNFGEMSEEMKQALSGETLEQITFTEENIGFWTDVLWALGLTQKSKVLAQGPMQQNAKQTPIKNYASTAGWTLGAKDAMHLYNSQRLIELTAEQDELVYRVAENIFRPCCGNSTAYPDCNHGMAVLGLLELMANQGAGEEEMYKAALAFNSYAFADTYVTVAAYFGQQGKQWSDIDAKTILGQTYSSGQGAAFVSKSVGEIPGAPNKGASCGA